jgi:hypothetical protein
MPAEQIVLVTVHDLELDRIIDRAKCVSSNTLSMSKA